MSAPPEMWFIFSELEGQRASSFRQERWCRVFLGEVPRVTVFNLRGALGLHVATLDGIDALEKFRAAALEVAAVQASVREGLWVRILRRLKHWSLADLFLPSVWKALSAGSERLRRLEGPVVILASSPPFSTVLIGAILKKRFPDRVRLLVDMRDAWALHTGLPGPRPVKKRIEGWCLRAADRVTTVSRGLADEFREVHGVAVDVLYNTATHYFDLGGVSPARLADIDPAIGPDSLTLVYTGSMPESFYDIGMLVEAGLRLRAGHPASAERLRLIFVGACEPLRRSVRRHRELDSLFVFVPHLEHRKAQAIQAGADVLIFLGYHGPGNKGVVSTKIFEYLALRKPILPVSVQPGSDVDALLESFCGKRMNLLTAGELVHALVDVAASGGTTLPRCAHPEKAHALFEDYRTFAASVMRP